MYLAYPGSVYGQKYPAKSIQTCYTMEGPSLTAKKPVFEVFDWIRNKPICTATEDGKRLKILDLMGSRVTVQSIKRNQRR